MFEVLHMHATLAKMGNILQSHKWFVKTIYVQAAVFASPV